MISDLTVTRLTADEARRCVDAINAAMTNARALLWELYTREGWLVLGHASWRACVTAEFGQSQAYLYRQLAAAEVEQNISPDSPIGELKEGQLRPLSALPPVYQRLAWQNAQQAADLIEPGSAPTASVIQASVEAVQEIIFTGGYVSIGGDSVAADRPLGDEHAGLLAATVDAIRERQLRSAQHRADGSRHLLTLPIALSDDGLIDIAEITFPPGALEAVRRLLRDQDCEFILTVKRLAPNPVTQES